jgi:hypothetical protein
MGMGRKMEDIVEDWDNGLDINLYPPDNIFLSALCSANEDQPPSPHRIALQAQFSIPSNLFQSTHAPCTINQNSTNFLSTDLPPVKPSAIALGTVFNHAASLAILGPVFGDTYHRAQSANSKEEFIKSKEAASAAAAWGTSIVGSAVQSYGVGALINATGTLSYKGAAYLGSLIFMASSAPSVSFNLDDE